MCHPDPVPFTFFAHQIPVLPIKSRWPEVDGLALVVGSIAPDLWYVTNGWHYGPFNVHLWQDGHDWHNAIGHWGLLTLVICAVLRRWVFAVVPRAVPDCGDFHLRDLALLSRARPAWWSTLLCGIVGGATHVLLDSFTHPDGFVVERVGAFRTTLFSIVGHDVSLYRILQQGGTVFGTLIGLEMLRRIGRDRRVRAWYGVGAAARTEGDVALPPSARRALGAGAVLGVVVGLAYAYSRSEFARADGRFPEHRASVPIMAFCCVFAVAIALSSVIAVAIERRTAAAQLQAT